MCKHSTLLYIYHQIVGTLGKGEIKSEICRVFCDENLAGDVKEKLQDLTPKVLIISLSVHNLQQRTPTK